MSLHNELLATARTLRELAQPIASRPAPMHFDGVLCALFHLLIDDALTGLLPTPEQQGAVGRSFDHTRMRGTCVAIQKSPLPPPLAAALGLTSSLPQGELRRVAEIFEDLQAERHDADYNRNESYTHVEG